jgi:hypothetical protein
MGTSSRAIRQARMAKQAGRWAKPSGKEKGAVPRQAAPFQNASVKPSAGMLATSQR